MNTKKSLQSNLLLVLTALIWGVAFVAQHAGNEIGSFTFNAVRSLVGGIALLPVILFFDRRNARLAIPKPPQDKKKLILGGVHIPYEKGLLGHSDADVLAHAIADALLGAATLGDIGVLFPDDDPQYAGADSLKLLAVAVAAVRRKGFGIENIDATILAQRPKLRPYIDEMRRNIASACNLDLDCVSIKATTEEGLGFTGRGEGIAAHAVCLLK